jgi:hypothetical protein
MDKAYICINYPSSSGLGAKDSSWTLGHALRTAKVPSNVREEILSCVDEQGASDVASIRRLFSKWVKDTRLSGSRHASTTGHAITHPSRSHPALALDDESWEASDSNGMKILRTLSSDGDCATASVGRHTSRSGVLRAVTLADRLQRIHPSAKGNPDFQVVIRYRWASHLVPRTVTAYRKALVTYAMTQWSTHASIEFEEILDEAEDVDIVIAFQDAEPDSELRSYYSPRMLHEDELEGAEKGLPGHNILLRIFRSAVDAAVWDRTKRNTGRPSAKNLNIRSALHEVGARHFYDLPMHPLMLFRSLVTFWVCNMSATDFSISWSITSGRLAPSGMKEKLRSSRAE